MSWWKALGLIGVLLVALVWLIPAAPLTGDGQYYIQFVRNGLQHGASSWHERRLLGPLIVHSLPLDAQTGFFWLTCASLGITALLTWLAARQLVASEAAALLAVPLLIGTWVVAPNLREYGLVDPLAWAFAAGVWLATVRRQWWLAGLLAAVGVLAKEVLVLMAVAAAAAAWDRQRWWRPLAVGLPACLVAGALTVLFPGSGTDAVAYLLKWVHDGLGSLGPGRIAFLLFAAYGAQWLLLPSGYPGLPRHLRRAGAVLLLSAIVLPLVGSPERMEEAIFPLVIASSVLALRDWPAAAAWAFALASVVFVARVGGDARIPTVLAWASLALACGLVLWRALGPRLAVRPLPGLLSGPRPPGTTARST